MRTDAICQLFRSSCLLKASSIFSVFVITTNKRIFLTNEKNRPILDRKMPTFNLNGFVMALLPNRPPNDEVSNKDILTALNVFANSIEQRFVLIEQRLDRIEQRLDSIEARLDHMETRMNKVEATMVTKDYLDDKLGDLRGNLTFKFNALTDVLTANQVITSDHGERVKRIRI